MSDLDEQSVLFLRARLPKSKIARFRIPLVKRVELEGSPWILACQMADSVMGGSQGGSVSHARSWANWEALQACDTYLIA